MTKKELIMQSLEDLDETLEWLYANTRDDMRDYDLARREIETGLQRFNDYAGRCEIEDN